PNGYCVREEHWAASGFSPTFTNYRFAKASSRAPFGVYPAENFVCADYAGDKYLLLTPYPDEGPYCDTQAECDGGPKTGLTCKKNLYSGNCKDSDKECSADSDCCSGNCSSGVCVENSTGYCVAACEN